jgi:predicted secreted protein
MPPTQNPEKRMQILALMEKFSYAAEGVPHTTLLEALLSMYVVVAETYPCCTQSAATEAFQVVMRLGTTAAERPAGAAVH